MWTSDKHQTFHSNTSIQLHICLDRKLHSNTVWKNLSRYLKFTLIFREKETFVLAGSTQRSQATKYSICAHFIHPLWNTTHLHTHDYDYQLILLEQPIPVTPSSRPIAIGNVEDVKEGELVAVSGWGHTKYKVGFVLNLVDTATHQAKVHTH